METQRAMANTLYILHFLFHLNPIPSHIVTPSLILLFINQSLPYYGGHSKSVYSMNEVPSPPEYQRCSYLAQPKSMTSFSTPVEVTLEILI